MLNLSHFIVTCVGLTKEGSGVAAVLTYTSPLFVFGLTVLFLKDKIATTGLLGSLLGFSGILVIFMNRMVPLRLQTILLLLAGAFLWAASTVYYKRCLSNVDPFVAGFLQIYLGIGPLLVVSTVSESVVYPLHTTTYFLVMLYASLAGTVIASTLWLILVNKEDITVVSGSSFAVPIFAFLFGWMLLGESFETKAMIGAVLVIVGVYLVNSTSRFDSHMRTFENSIKAFIQRLDNKD
jgi:O-acetylserine/cysteine efflux transporter